MSTKPDSESPAAQPQTVAQTGIARRRLLRAGLSAAPVILAVSGRSAMATGGGFNSCDTPRGLSPMAWSSIAPNGGEPDCSNTSHTVGSSALGLSPGYWRPNTKNVTLNSFPNGNAKTFQPPKAWPVPPFDSVLSKQPGGGTLATPWNPGNYLLYRGVLSTDGGFANGAKFNSFFTGAISDTRSFSRILIDEDGTVKWHLCAAYLNCLAFQSTYALTLIELLELSNGTIGTRTGVSDSEIKAFLNQTWS